MSNAHPQQYDDPAISPWLRFDARSLNEDEWGYVQLTGIAARPGIYSYGHGTELVTAKELRASAPRLDGKPLTLHHPNGMLTSDVALGAQHGHVVKAWVLEDGDPLLSEWDNARVDDLAVRVQVTTDQFKGAIRSGMTQLSPGYRLTDLGPGGNDPSFGRHDSSQIGRRYNHLAGVMAANGGDRMRVRLDGAPNVKVQCERHDNEQPTQGRLMTATISYNGRRVECSDAKARALATVRMDADRADQIETGTVVVTLPDEEPIELTLPISMIEAMLSTVGAEPAAKSPPAPDVGEAPPEDSMADAADEERGDSLDASVRRVISTEVRKALGAELARRDAANLEAATVRKDAAGHLPETYDFSRSDHWQQAADAIARVDPEKSARANTLAKWARADGRDAPHAAAELRGMLSMLRSDATTKTQTVEDDDRNDQKQVSRLDAARQARDTRQGARK